jgi:TFIIF-interacting CTD phosphatase-like protein
MFNRKFATYTLSTLSVFGFGTYGYRKSRSTNKLNIVLDLDNTLISSMNAEKYADCNKSKMSLPDVETVYVEDDGSTHIDYYVWKRPFLNIVIPLLAKFNNLHLMTRADQDYADEIIEKCKIDKYFQTKRYHDDCGKDCKNIQGICSSQSAPDNIILVDDDKRNNCEGENFYHIAYYSHFNRLDCELLKLLFIVCWMNVKSDAGKLKNTICSFLSPTKL